MQERTENADLVHVFEHVVAELKVPTGVEQDELVEGVEHRLVDVETEVDAGFEVDFGVEIGVEVDAGDVAGPEVDFVVGLVVEVDAGDDAEFGLEKSQLAVGALMKIVLSKFVLGVGDAQLQHTWTDIQQ